MDIRTIAQARDSITIEEVNLPYISYSKNILDVRAFWHKFLIEDVHGLKRNAVLKIFFDHIKPIDLIPLCYTETGQGAYFFARICRQAIQKFCSDRLIVANPHDDTKPFKLKIILKYTTTNIVKVDLSENVLKVLQKRFKSPVLCLNNFCEDPDLTDFFLLSQPRLLAFVLNVAKTLKPKAIKLCNNGIKTLDALRMMPPQSITSLDLRNNLITDLVELKHLENFSITELWLEGNPLCDLYDEYSYVQQMIRYCPKIEKLDGFLLRQNGFPSFRRNFLCNLSAYEVVDQFLCHYFPTYDSKNVTELEELYHKNALFSMTAEFLDKQLSSPNSQLKSYKLFGRNLLNSPNSGSTNLYIGSTDIMRLFKILPRSEHDPYSFTVDVLYYSAKCAVIVVTGVFMEIPNVERILGFNRYFVLECRDEHNYRIANEQLHIFNALTSQQVTAFKKPDFLQEARNQSEKNQMINAFMIITNLNKEWATMFLEECRFNFKHAMLLFVDLYKSDRVPVEGFKNFA